MERRDKHFSGVFLSLLMFLIPFTQAYLLGSFFQQPREVTKTVEIAGSQQLATIITYPNGSELVKLSITVENIAANLPKMRINFTQLFSLEQLSYYRGEKSQSLTDYSTDSGLPWKDWDNMRFVVPPGNESIWVKYEHDDNYETYYPTLWNMFWEVEPGTYGNEKFHTHLAVSTLNDWIAGTISDEEVHRLILSGGSLAVGIIGTALAALIAYFMGAGVKGLIISVLVGALAALFAWLLQVLGITNKSKWISDVVQAEQGDGFHWAWGFKTIFSDTQVFGDGGGEPMCEGPGRYEITLLTYTVREFQRSWGAERDSPGTYTVEFWNVYDLVIRGYQGTA